MPACVSRDSRNCQRRRAGGATGALRVALSCLASPGVRWTGLTQKTLEANWDAGGMLTSCNAFAGKIAQEIGVPRKSVLAKGVLDISQADKEVPGCWQDANSSEACLNNITPQAGDIYSSWTKVKYKGKEFIQKWGHVGIVYSFEDDGTWWLIQGGQGGPGGRVDYIRWKNTHAQRTSSVSRDPRVPVGAIAESPGSRTR